MPAVHFEVQWPDGEKQLYYSPSTVVYEHLKENQKLPLDAFAKQAQIALTVASERVKQKFGYYCSAASAEQDKISAKVAALKRMDVNGDVTVIGFTQ